MLSCRQGPFTIRMKSSPTSPLMTRSPCSSSYTAYLGVHMRFTSAMLSRHWLTLVNGRFVSLTPEVARTARSPLAFCITLEQRGTCGRLVSPFFRDHRRLTARVVCKMVQKNIPQQTTLRTRVLSGSKYPNKRESGPLIMFRCRLTRPVLW